MKVSSPSSCSVGGFAFSASMVGSCSSMGRLMLGLAQHLARAARDHQFLVRRNDPGGGAGTPRHERAAGRIGCLVEFDPRPGGAAQDLGACRRVVLADAPRE